MWDSDFQDGFFYPREFETELSIEESDFESGWDEWDWLCNVLEGSGINAYPASMMAKEYLCVDIPEECKHAFVIANSSMTRGFVVRFISKDLVEISDSTLVSAVFGKADRDKRKLLSKTDAEAWILKWILGNG